MKLRTFASFALSGALTMAAATGTGNAADKITYQLDWLPGGDKAPIYVCIHNGFCKDAGLEITLEQGRGSSEAVTKLATGISDIGTAGLGALMAARAAENVPVTGVLSVFNKGPHAFYTLKGNGVTAVKDVKGKKIATSPFTSSNVYLPLVLGDMGMTEADISLTKANPGALGPMLMTGKTDVMIAWMTDVSRYTRQARAAGKELIILPWSTAGLDLYSASLVASDKFLKERPDVARRFVAAYIKSLEFAGKDPVAAGKAVSAIVPEIAADAATASWKDAAVLVFNEVTEKDGLGSFEPKRLAATWERVSKAQKLDPSNLDPEAIVNRSFAAGS